MQSNEQKTPGDEIDSPSSSVSETLQLKSPFVSARLQSPKSQKQKQAADVSSELVDLDLLKRFHALLVANGNSAASSSSSSSNSSQLETMAELGQWMIHKFQLACTELEALREENQLQAKRLQETKLEYTQSQDTVHQLQLDRGKLVQKLEETQSELILMEQNARESQGKLDEQRVSVRRLEQQVANIQSPVPWDQERHNLMVNVIQ